MKNAILCATLLIIAACTPTTQTVDKLSCTADADCICGGKDKATGDCYLGNKDYYAQNVDASQDCPDFCGGIAGNLEVKCVENKCVQKVISQSYQPVCGNGKCEIGEDICGATCPKDVVCELKCAPEYCPEDCATPKVQGECSSDADCGVGGCSSQVCGPADRVKEIVTTCEYRPEYACLKQTSCGCVENKCAWKENDAYAACLAQVKGGEVIV